VEQKQSLLIQILFFSPIRAPNPIKRKRKTINPPEKRTPTRGRRRAPNTMVMTSFRTKPTLAKRRLKIKKRNFNTKMPENITKKAKKTNSITLSPQSLFDTVYITNYMPTSVCMKFHLLFGSGWTEVGIEHH